MKEIESVCIYCGVGCKLRYLVDDENRIIRVLPSKSDPVSRGKPCIKGLTIHEVVDKGRILNPLIKKRRKLKEITWEKAFDILVKKLEKFSSDEIILVGSGKIPNEDNFVIQKFGRVVLRTNNVDGCCARLCHAPTVIGFKGNFGIGAVPHYWNEIPKMDCLLIIGSNPASNYPVLFDRILEMRKNGGKIITVAPIYSETATFSNLHISIYPGTETAFLNCIINLLIQKNAIRKDADKIPNFQELRNVVAKYDIKTVSKICRVKESELEEAAEIIANSKNFGIMHGMGLTQHVNGIENVHTLANLVILKNGKIFSGRGEINVQGAGDMLVSPTLLPFSDSINVERARKLWGELTIERGTNIIEAFGLGQVKAALISGFNPAHSLPDLNRIHKNLKKMFLVQMDSYFNLTSQFADLILPTPILIEREGTITNGERMVRFIKKVREPLGESLPEWKIYTKLAKMMGFEKQFNYKTEKDIFKEITLLVKAYSHIDPEKVYSGQDAYADKRIKFERFIPEEFEGAEEISNRKYPFVLFTFRSRYHFLSGEATLKSKTLTRMPDKPYFYINKKDAEELKLKDGDEVKVSSKVASIKGKVKIDKRIPKGFIGAHFHFDNLLINKLFPLQFDEETFTPNFKTVAVKIKKL